MTGGRQGLRQFRSEDISHALAAVIIIEAINALPIYRASLI
jgi:hypothetical protein